LPKKNTKTYQKKQKNQWWGGVSGLFGLWVGIFPGVKPKKKNKRLIHMGGGGGAATSSRKRRHRFVGGFPSAVNFFSSVTPLGGWGALRGKPSPCRKGQTLIGRQGLRERRLSANWPATTIDSFFSKTTKHGGGGDPNKNFWPASKMPRSLSWLALGGRSERGTARRIPKAFGVCLVGLVFFVLLFFVFLSR